MTPAWISRRRLMQYTLATAAGMAFRNVPCVAETPADDPMRKLFGKKLEVTDLGSGLSMVANGGGNSVIAVQGDDLLVVDSGMPFRADDLLGVVSQLAPSAKRKVLFNTHWHFDHVGGNSSFAAAGFVIAGTDSCRARMGQTIVLEDMGRTAEPSPESARPTITFAETLDLFQGVSAHISKFAPAHTDTDAALQFNHSGVLQTGDLHFNGVYPVIDRSTGGSLDGMITATKRLLDMADDKTKVVPGHGPLGDHQSLNAQLELLQLTQQRLAPLAEKKLTMDEVVTMAPLADLDEKWGRGFLRSPIYTRMAYGQWVTRKP